MHLLQDEIRIVRSEASVQHAPCQMTSGFRNYELLEKPGQFLLLWNVPCDVHEQLVGGANHRDATRPLLSLVDRPQNHDVVEVARCHGTSILRRPVGCAGGISIGSAEVANALNHSARVGLETCSAPLYAPVRPPDKRKRVLPPLQCVEIRQIVEVLRALLIPAAEPALLLHRQAVHLAATD